MGGKASTRRTAEQTEIARFWEFSLPSIYHGVVRSVADMPGRDPVRNARLFAAVAQAMDDAMIAVFDAKYHYNFWRPSTAIRNGDIDGNDATEREASWTPFIDTPMHPEYPSAHSILASAVGAVLKAELGDGPMPMLSTTSPTRQGCDAQLDEHRRRSRRKWRTRACTKASTTGRRPTSAAAMGSEDRRAGGGEAAAIRRVRLGDEPMSAQRGCTSKYM